MDVHVHVHRGLASGGGGLARRCTCRGMASRRRGLASTLVGHWLEEVEGG